ncbi:MAG: PAS domain-containing protein [Sediminicola sp.]|jgi:PAS domain-containing protein
MYVLASILIEFLLIATFILVLFNLRDKIGLAPVYILIGSLQYFQVNLENLVSFKFLGEYPVYPGSIVLFSAVLFSVLLIYIKEGVLSARTLILGILISNLFLSGLFEITSTQDYFVRKFYGADVSGNSVFSIDYKFFSVGSIILFIDFFLLVIVYQFLITKIKKPFFFLTLFLSLWSVLIFDALVFNTTLFFGTTYFKYSLIGHIFGKTLSALLYSSVLYIYLTYVDKGVKTTSFITDQKRDIFSILFYKKKYMSLKIEKENVEEKLISEKKEVDEALLESEAFNKGILSSLSAHIAVIDSTGKILAVNKAWNDFSLNNGELNLERTSVDSNYIEVCEKALAMGDTLSEKVLEGIRSVLNKSAPNFIVEYPFHAPTGKCWFSLNIVPFGTTSNKLVISHTNVTQLIAVEEKLERSNEKLKEAQRTAKIGSWEINPSTKEVDFSDEMYNILEIDKETKEDLYGLYRSKCMPEDDERFEELTTNAIKNGKGYSIGYYIKSRDNNLKYIHEIVEIVKDASGKTIKLKGTLQDETKNKLINDQLSQKNEELLKANKELDRFVYSASHDLRAPLTSLRGLIQIVEMTQKPEHEEFKEPLSLMSTTIDKMDVFIRSIFDYSMNARAKITVEKIDFEEVLGSIWESLKYMNIKYTPKVKIYIKQKVDFF